MRSLPVMLMIAGGVLFAVGGLLWLAARLGLPLGRLPGDVNVEGKGLSVHFPLITCIVLSLLLTVVLNLYFFFRR